MTTFGKYRHLSQCSTDAGHFNILAIDHRGAMQKAIAEANNRPVSDEDFSVFKQEVIGQFSPVLTAVLTDPDFGYPAVTSGALPGTVGLLAPLELTDYGINANERPIKYIEGWSVEQIKFSGAAGVKVLVFYHPDAPNAQMLEDQVAQIIMDCNHYDIPLFLEPIAFSMETGERDGIPNDELRRVVIDSAKLFCEMGTDVLKAQFPLDASQGVNEVAWAEACKELNEACGGVPWVLLSAGVDYETYRLQVQIACDAGASGILCGRAAWAEAVTMPQDERRAWLATVGLERMQELGKIVSESATSWKDLVAAPDVPMGWYKG